jgi:hypothetical protein
MFRLFRRRPRHPVVHRRQSVRPAIESLEERDLLSVAVVTTTDPRSGAPELRVTENGRNDKVTITDDSAAHTTTVTANGKKRVINQLFSLFDLELMGQRSMLEFDLASTLSARMEHLQVNLGKGENHFSFDPGMTGITNHSDVSVNVLGHNGNDYVNLSFGNILESRVNVLERNLGGSRSTVSPTMPRDSINFGALRAGIRNSSVDVNVGLGEGLNNLTFNYGSDLGHLAPPNGTPASAGDFGPSTFNVSITGSSRSQDAANVLVFANGEVNTGSTLNFATQFLAGNNTFKTVIDAAQFQIDDDGGQFIPVVGGATPPHSGGAAHFLVRGGSGNDNISFASINQASTTELSGTLDINVVAGAGKDKINVDFGGTGGFTDDDPFELAATNRMFRLRIDGGTGADTINVNLANAPTSTFAWDVAIVGGSEHNDITFKGNNQNGTPSFGPFGNVFIDGDFGTNSDVNVSGNFPVEVLNAN